MIEQLLIITFDIFYLLFLIFTLYYCAVVIASLIKKKKVQDNQDETTIARNNNMIVIIYAHNNEDTVVSLLESLLKQDYPHSNYQIHIILDNCTDDSSNKLEIIGGAKIWRLNDEQPQGKDKAVSWLLENLISFKNVDAYVFLDATNMITPNFLKNVNNALLTDDVIVGSRSVIVDNPTLKQSIFEKVNKYNNSVMRLGRSKLSLAVPIDSSVTILKQEIIKQIQCIDFKDANSELKYSFLLLSNGFLPVFHNEIRTYVYSKDFELKRPDFGFKYSIFVNCLRPNLLKNWRFSEFLLHLFKPNPFVFLAITFLLLYFGITYNFNIPTALIVIPTIALVLSFILSLLKAKISIKALLHLCVFPFISLLNTIKELEFFKKIFTRNKELAENTETLSVNVNVTNGQKNYPCTLDLISDNGFKKVVFRYGNKKRESRKECVRMYDAIANMSDILSKNGFRMQICQNCAYFTSKIDGSDNMVKGFCNKNIVNDESMDIYETVLWNCCENYIPEEVNNVINLADFAKDKHKED